MTFSKENLSSGLTFLTWLFLEVSYRIVMADNGGSGALIKNDLFRSIL